jgi:antitoxin component YwqK of YwqJK toxin-antitoxin module
MRSLILSLFLCSSAWAAAQTVLPYVDHYDSLRTKKKSEGLMVNGLEWGVWKFWDREGHLLEESEFKSGQRDGHVLQYYDNGKVKHDGWIRTTTTAR